jgi:hypothetical protein
MGVKPLEPSELVVKFRPGLRIAVWQIDAAHQNAADRSFDIPRLCVHSVASKGCPRQDRLSPARKNGNAIPRLLSFPDRGISRTLKPRLRKRLVSAFEFLETNNVGPGRLQPAQQVWQPPVDVVDVESCDLHAARVNALRTESAELPCSRKS